jgi:hypothetical protein
VLSGDRLAGPLRRLPWWWPSIDNSVGALGSIPLLISHRMIKSLESESRPVSDLIAAK